MPKCKAYPVELPHLTSRVWLSPEMGKALELIIGSGMIGINEIDLIEAGVQDPRGCMRQLHWAGAVIYFTDIPTPDEPLWDEVRHFNYRGWIQTTQPLWGANIGPEGIRYATYN
jgi:hypothetical protein